MVLTLRAPELCQIGGELGFDAGPKVGHLEVFEEDVSDGEGNPPGRTVLPLVLKP
jgi:hypothetical protein